MRKISRKKGPVTSKVVSYDGITFKSGLEKHMYKALKDAHIDFQYEGKTYQLLDTFQFNSSSIERQSNGKGDFIDRGNKKVLGIKYTPDFEGNKWTCETKGRANESFPIRYKLFKDWVRRNDPGRLLLKPQTNTECNEAVEIIKKHLKNVKGHTNE
jgi:hypothetical protein